MNKVSEALGCAEVASKAQSVFLQVCECDRETALKGISTEQI